MKHSISPFISVFLLSVTLNHEIILISEAAVTPQASTTEKYSFSKLENVYENPIGDVHSIYQDSRGFIWIGSDQGLRKYDGYQQIVYQPTQNDSQSLSGLFVNCITGTPENQILIGTSLGFDVYDPKLDQFTRYLQDETDTSTLWGRGVSSVYIDSSSRIWVGTENGICRFHIDTGKFERMNLNPIDSQIWVPIETTSILEDPDGFLWICTRNGLYRFYPESKKAEKMELRTDGDEMFCSRVRFDPKGNLFVGTTSNGFFAIERNTGSIYHYQNDPKNPDSIPSNGVTDFAWDNSGTTWIATNNGLAIAKPETLLSNNSKGFTVLKKNDSRSDGFSLTDLVTIYTDNLHRLWFGGRSGSICVYDKSTTQFSHLKLTALGNEFRSNNMTDIVEDNEGNIWLGADGGGVYYWNRDQQIVETMTSGDHPRFKISSDKVLSLQFDSF